MGHLHGVDGTARRSLTIQAATTSALLSLLFLAVYGATNWISAQRDDLTTWCFAWERGTPFVPLMFVPYMSMDLLFVAAPFLCGNAKELKTYARRLTFSILTASGFFLLLPLRLGYERQAIEGWLGLGFDLFRALDPPHNLFPSLHVAQLAVMASIYFRHTHGLLRVVCAIWFALIVSSTLLTHQHHVIDLAGGGVLAGFAFFFFPESATRLPVVCNPRVGGYYAAGAVLMLGLGLALLPWGAFLLWPAAALGIVSAAYFGWGPGIFRKTAGRLPLSTRFVLAPALLGQTLSLLYYRRQCRAWDKAAPGVLIGRKLNRREAAEAIRRGVTAVLDLTGEFSEAAPFRTLAYRNIPVLDLTAPTDEQLHEAVAFITTEAAQGVVYVHCKIGYSRSAAVVGAYLLACNRAATVEEALAQIRRVRPSIVVRREAAEALRNFTAPCALEFCVQD